ncbi:MAG TPA: DUF6623 family protein [Candidatus Tectomicrobia bacterium]|jgi:hypothetical protein
MTLQAVWVHGHAGFPDMPYDEQGKPLGGYISSGSSDVPSYQGRPQTHVWFHFPIATPVIHNGIRVRLIKVFVLFRSDPQVALTEIHVWDGPRRVDAFSPEAGVSGLHDGSRGLADLIPHVTAWVVNQRPEIYWGLCVSARIQFKEEGVITFTSAGADFEF